MTAALRLLPVDVTTYERHPLHGHDRDWPETNCYVDLWVELLHSLQLDPVAGLAFTLAAGFDGDQWEFFKFPPADLRDLYGIEVREINVWRSLEQHIVVHLENRNLLTVEVDAWFLPDTMGVSYQLEHQKTTIVPQLIDTVGQRLGYFHNAGYFELTGDDYRGALRVTAEQSSLVPYVELIDLSRVSSLPAAELHAHARRLVQQHLSRRRAGNPVEQLTAQVAADTQWLRENPEQFHAYAFATLRSCGAWASTTSAFLAWLGGDQLGEAQASLESLSAAAKTAQFKLSRVARGRDADLGDLFETMARDWQHAIDETERFAGG